MIVNDRNGRLVASFPVEESDQIMLVTDGGKLIRCPVDDVRIAGRNVQGVRIFKTDDDEKVVSVERIPEDGNGEAGAENGNGEGEDRARNCHPGLGRQLESRDPVPASSGARLAAPGSRIFACANSGMTGCPTSRSSSPRTRTRSPACRAACGR